MTFETSSKAGINHQGRCLFPPKAKDRQAGQAMPLGIAAILVGFVGAFMLFNTGQVAVNKQRLSDASDSAAYSGMVWQARAMNFQAYTNRAMIANDVTIGQAVSLNSWSNYSTITTGNLATAVRLIPIVNVIVGYVAQAMAAVNQFVTPITEVMVEIVNGVNQVIEVAQDGMFYSAFVATPDIVKSVADASDDRFTAETFYGVGGIARNLAQWKDFTSKYTHDDMEASVERTDLINDSREKFATKRGWKFVDKFWVYTSPLARHRLYYEGETRLMMKASENADPKWEWVAKDTMSHHTKYITFSGWRIKEKRLEVPIGWAASYAKEDDSDSDAIDNCSDYHIKDKDSCKFLGNNKEGEKWADRGQVGIIPGRFDYGPYVLNGYDGIREFRSLSKDSVENEDLDPTLRLRTEVMMDLGDSNSSGDWVADDTRFSSELAGVGDKISSISIAEVYYRHPKAYRSSNDTIARQRANGYNPYWDVRLVPVELTERLLALGSRLDLNSSASTPGLTGYPETEGDSDLEVAGNIDTDLIVDALPEYAGTLASAMGLDEAAETLLTEQIGNFVPGGVGAIEDFQSVVALYGDQDQIVENLKNEIGDELKDELKDAAVNILAGLVTDYTGLTRDDQQQVIDDVEEAQAIAEGYIEDMQRIEALVADDFETALRDLVGSYEPQIVAHERSISNAFDTYQGVLNGPYGEDTVRRAYDTYIRAKEGIEDLIDDATDQLKEDLVDRVLDSVLTHGAEYFPEGLPRQLIEGDVVDLLTTFLDQTEEERNARPRMAYLI